MAQTRSTVTKATKNGAEPAPAGAPPADAGARAPKGMPGLVVDVSRPDLRPGSRKFNRDLSWLQFNARVLHQALDERAPLLERAKFLGIFTSNLDEFVMKRVGFWLGARDAGLDPDHGVGLAPTDMLRTIRQTFEHLEEQQTECFQRHVRPGLAREGIDLLDYADLAREERQRLADWFDKNVFPVVTPLAVDEGHKFPFISNLSSSLAVLLADPASSEPVFARIKVPPGMPQWVRVPEGEGERAEAGRGRFVQLWQVLADNLDDVFPGCRVLEVAPFRVTRAAETPEDDRDDTGFDNLLEEVEQQLRRRRFARVVRLEVARNASPTVRRQLTEMLDINAEDIDPLTGLLDFRTLFEIADLPRPDLKQKAWTPVVPARLRDTEKSMFELIRRADVLVHHPYESFSASAERFIAEAAADPAVLAIKQTIYRTSRESPFVAHLIKAAESGKQVACLVELRARFDEGRNVRLAQLLEKAGVHVAYGVVGLKTHCKAALVVRREGGGLRSYAHIGTGNYNPSTAALYTDLGLFTCDPVVTRDVAHLFNLLTGRATSDPYQKLMVAPRTLKPGFLRLIRREADLAREHGAGRAPVGGRIIAKMNALEDKDVMDALYDASSAGVQIDLFVRGFCCLRPGVPGLSENIRVTSVIGRFLEHSRLFYFGAGQADPLAGEWFIGSADWMGRNLDGRVEAVCPVHDQAARTKLLRLLQIMSEDRRNAWRLQADGRYLPLVPRPDAPADTAETLGTFQALMNDALAGR
jgi:polyphosphate kinase